MDIETKFGLEVTLKHISCELESSMLIVEPKQGDGRAHTKRGRRERITEDLFPTLFDVERDFDLGTDVFTRPNVTAAID